MSLRNNLSAFGAKAAVSAVCFTVSTFPVNAEEAEWGIGAVIRSASIPYLSEFDDDYVSSFVPLFYFEGETFYLDGLEGGVKLYEDIENDWQLHALVRTRFVDIPRAVQNEAGGDSADMGFKLTYPLIAGWQSELELLSDPDFNLHTSLNFSREYEQGNWELEPGFSIRYKSSGFNSQFYALEEYTGEKISGGVDLGASLDIKYHVVSNLYLLGGAGVTYLDNNAYNSDVVDHRWQGELYAGIGFFNDKSRPRKRSLSNAPYLRVAHGWATPSNMGDILLRFDIEKDEYNNQLSSVFYGHPLTDELFGLDLDIYLTPGVVHHWSSEVQGSGTEYVVAVKAYYTFNWPVKWRIGAAEGLSYIDSITYIEGTDMERKGYEPSKLLNYLDISYDVNLGDLFRKPDWNNIWFGYSLHHRSAIFESASQFGRIKGGSNYNTFYLQVDF